MRTSWRGSNILRRRQTFPPGCSKRTFSWIWRVSEVSEPANIQKKCLKLKTCNTFRHLLTQLLTGGICREFLPLGGPIQVFQVSPAPGGGQRDPGLRQRLPGEFVAAGGLAEDPRLPEAGHAQAAAGAETTMLGTMGPWDVPWLMARYLRLVIVMVVGC